MNKENYRGSSKSRMYLSVKRLSTKKRAAKANEAAKALKAAKLNKSETVNPLDIISNNVEMPDDLQIVENDISDRKRRLDDIDSESNESDKTYNNENKKKKIEVSEFIDNNNFVDYVDNVNKKNKSLKKDEKEITLEGRRIVDFEHLFSALKTISNPENHDFGTDCSLKNIILIGERRTGLASTLKLKCNMCNRYYSLQTTYDPLGINEQAVLGIMSIGLGYTHLEKLTASLEIPYGSHCTFDKYHDIVCDKMEETSQEAINEAIEEEKKIAVDCGNVIKGVPFITVKCDGFWAKRSYKRNYTSLSGCAAVIGAKTNKVISIGVRNKYCVVCKKYENKGTPPKSHRCFKNWMLSSSAMESDIISNAFQESVTKYGVIFKTMIADGDSSCYQKLLERDPYATFNIQVEKIECRNHLLRNYINKLVDISKNTRAGPAVLRKKIKDNIMRFRSSITKAIQYRSGEGKLFSEKVEGLRKDIINSPSHILGEHKNCSEYFCKEEYKSNSLVSDMKLTDLYNTMMIPVRYLANHSKSLLHNVDTNTVEQFNSIICKHIGGKRINYCSKRSFQARCHASVLQWNTKQMVSIMSQALTGTMPLLSKKIENRYTRLRKKYLRKKIYQKTNNKDYGESCRKPDLKIDEFELSKEEYISNNYKKSEEELNKIEQNTRNQTECQLWFEERGKRITASHFGNVCRMLPKTSRKRLVEQIIYPKALSTAAVMHGRQYEGKAIEEIEHQINKKILKCGLHVDKKQQFLAASPDGILEDGSAIIEVKCPYSAKAMTPSEGIESGKIPFWKKNGDINLKHKWYYQIQGQLHITGHKKCIFGIYTFKGVKIVEVNRDDTFWEKMMQEPLNNFFKKHFLYELVDPRRTRNMAIRD